MVVLPFAVRRPWYLVRYVFADRNNPQLEKLRRTTSPEKFLWAILPHAARTFAACIAMMPSHVARATAVGYLYARILDNYEDLTATEDEGIRLIRLFASRFGRTPSIDAPARHRPFPEAPQMTNAQVVDGRDRAHLLLIEHCDRIDDIFLALPAFSQRAVIRVIRDIAGGMIWARRVFARQNGRLNSDEQALAYCRAVIGNPVAFVQTLTVGRDLTAEERANALRVGEFMDLANLMRDVEKDYARGVSYSPKLKDGCDSATVQEVRRDFMRLALERAPAYTAMLRQFNFRFWSFSRASGLLALEFADRFYRGSAQRMGKQPWTGPESAAGILLQPIPALFSQKYTMRRARAIESNMTQFAAQQLVDES